MRKLILYYLIIGLAFATSADRAKAEQAMTFRYVGNGGNCLGCEWFAAEGEITETTPILFEKFIKKYPYRFTVFLNSSGGNLQAGMELGRLFRKHKLNTSVGDTYEDPEFLSDHTKEGICASACAYAFMGGIDRSVYEGNILALHQFHNRQNKVGFNGSIVIENDELSIDQLLSGSISAYLSEMGIDGKALAIAASAGKDNLLILDEESLYALNIVPVFASGEWVMDATESGLEIRTKDDDPHAIVTQQKIGCENGRAIIAIKTLTTQDLTAQEMREEIRKLTLEVGDHKEDISPNNISLVRLADGYEFIIKINDEQKKRILDIGEYSIDFDTARLVFGTWIAAYGDFNSGTGLNKLKQTWASCD